MKREYFFTLKLIFLNRLETTVSSKITILVNSEKLECKMKTNLNLINKHLQNLEKIEKINERIPAKLHHVIMDWF